MKEGGEGGREQGREEGNGEEGKVREGRRKGRGGGEHLSDSAWTGVERVCEVAVRRHHPNRNLWCVFVLEVSVLVETASVPPLPLNSFSLSLICLFPLSVFFCREV